LWGSSPIIHDLNNDDTLDILVSTGSGYIYGFNGIQSTIFPGFPFKLLGGKTFSFRYKPPVVVDDFLGDGNLDIISASSDGDVYIWNLEIPFNDSVENSWRTFKHDNYGSNNSNFTPPEFINSVTFSSKVIAYDDFESNSLNSRPEFFWIFDENQITVVGQGDSGTYRTFERFTFPLGTKALKFPSDVSKEKHIAHYISGDTLSVKLQNYEFFGTIGQTSSSTIIEHGVIFYSDSRESYYRLRADSVSNKFVFRRVVDGVEETSGLGSELEIDEAVTRTLNFRICVTTDSATNNPTIAIKMWEQKEIEPILFQLNIIDSDANKLSINPNLQLWQELLSTWINCLGLAVVVVVTFIG